MDEFRITVRATLKNTTRNANLTLANMSKSFTQAGNPGMGPGKTTCTTSDTVVTLTGITSPGWISITNHDLTNYVEFGPTAAGAIVPFVYVPPLATVLFYMAASVTLRSRANTATVITTILCAER